LEEALANCRGIFPVCSYSETREALFGIICEKTWKKYAPAQGTDIAFYQGHATHRQQRPRERVGIEATSESWTHLGSDYSEICKDKCEWMRKVLREK